MLLRFPHNLAEGGCLVSRFYFMCCRYFLGHVACRNLPWKDLIERLKKRTNPVINPCTAGSQFATYSV